MTDMLDGKVVVISGVGPGLGTTLARRCAKEGADLVLVKRDDAWYSDNWDTAPHKLHVRAETFFGKIDVRRDRR